MKRDKLALYVHLVWATWDRSPWITPQIERPLHRCIAKQAEDLGCTVVALNGMPDHVHLVVGLPATVAIGQLVKQAKGVSSRFAGDDLGLGSGRKWQGWYGAFSVSRWDVTRIAEYVRRQKQRHRAGDLVAQLEETEEEVDPLELASPST